MKNTREQILSFAENELIEKESIRRAVLSETPQKQRKNIAWTKILLPIAACLVLAFGTVFLIPSARAEVLSWFGVSTPQDYLTTNPDNRESIPELDALIASPAATDEVVTIPIDRADSEAVMSEGALKVSAFLHENCDIQLGEAMFDGETIYQTIRMNGLSGLYLLEQYTGAYAMAVPVDPAKMTNEYDPPMLEEYLSGEKTLYEWPNGRIMYEMPDGTRFGGSVDLGSSIEEHLHYLREMGLLTENRTEEQRTEIDRQNRLFLEKNGLVAFADVQAYDFEKYLDADGNLTAKVYYVVDVVEEDHDDVFRDTELFNAQIGTITVNMKAYQDIESTGLTADDTSVVWGAETVTVSNFDIDFGDPDDNYADDRVWFAKYRVSTDGLKMAAEEIEMDALGIRNLNIRITVPEAWTQEEREAFAGSLEWKVLLNGESGSWYLDAYQCVAEEDGTLLFTSRGILEVPYDMLKSIKTITLAPTLRAYESITPYDYNHTLLGVLNPDYGETVWSERGVCGWNYKHAETEYPQYAITLHVN